MLDTAIITKLKKKVETRGIGYQAMLKIIIRVKPGFCIRTRNSTNDAGLFRPQKVRPMSQIALTFFRRKSLGFIRLGSHA